MQFLRALFRSNKKLVGTDLTGNKYFETIRESGKPKREIISDLKPDEYEHGSVPAAWEAWLRHRREDPPTHEELIGVQQRIEIIQEKGKIIAEKIKSFSRKKLEGLVAEPSSEVDQMGHASSPFYKSLEQSQEPTSTGATFQPGAWAPSQSQGTPTEKKSTNSSTQKPKKSETFEPETWSPPSK